MLCSVTGPASEMVKKSGLVLAVLVSAGIWTKSHQTPFGHQGSNR